MNDMETINYLIGVVENVIGFRRRPKYGPNGELLAATNNTLEELIETAEAQFFVLADDAEDKAKYYYLLGKMYNCSPKYRSKAQEVLSKSVKLDPEAVESWNELGECYWFETNLDMAKTCFERALEQRENKLSYRSLSVVVRKQGLTKPTNGEKHKSFEEAINLAKKSVQLDPSDGVSWSILGNAYLALFFSANSEYQHAIKAIAAYKNAEKNLEVIDNFEIFYNKGIVLKYIEHYSDALDTLQKTMESETTWDLPCQTYNSLIEYLDEIMSYIGHKGRLKPKKFYAMLKELSEPKLGPYASHKLIFIKDLVEGVNSKCVLFGKVVWSFQEDNFCPFTLGLVDVHGQEVVVTVFNLSITHRSFVSGDSVVIPDPWFVEVNDSHKGKVYRFPKVRVENPTNLIVNDKPLPNSCYSKMMFDTLPVQF